MGAIFDHDAFDMINEMERIFTKSMGSHPAVTKNNEERPGGIKIRRQDILIAADAAADCIKRIVAEERSKFAGIGQTEGTNNERT